MEERNMQLDDDGKIKMRKNREDFLDHPEKEDDEEIVIDVPDFAGFREEDDNVGLSGDELSAKNQLYEQYVAEKKGAGRKDLRAGGGVVRGGRVGKRGRKIPRQRGGARRQLESLVRRGASADQGYDGFFGHI